MVQPWEPRTFPLTDEEVKQLEVTRRDVIDAEVKLYGLKDALCAFVVLGNP